VTPRGSGAKTLVAIQPPIRRSASRWCPIQTRAVLMRPTQAMPQAGRYSLLISETVSAWSAFRRSSS
jgi:hypothetical protein